MDFKWNKERNIKIKKHSSSIYMKYIFFSSSNKVFIGHSVKIKIH